MTDVAAGARKPKTKDKSQKSDVRIDQLKETDLLAAARLMYKTADEMRKQAGRPLFNKKLKAAPPLLSHIYRQDPDLQWGIYDGEKLIGFSSSHMRDRQWHVAYLFVDSAHQGKGHGTQLLRTGLDEARKREAHFTSQCTFIYNIRAVGLYTRMGMFPRKNLMLMEGPVANTVDWPKPSSPIQGQPINSTALLSDLNHMDREVRGINRSADHCYWLADDDYDGYVFTHGGNKVGYAYVSQMGCIGPVLAMRDTYLPDIVAFCLNKLAERPDVRPRIWLNGKNFATLQMVLSNGFQIKEIGLLLTNRMFCDVRRYVGASMAVF